MNPTEKVVSKGRPKIREDKFLSLIEHWSEAERNVVRHLIDWATEKGLYKEFRSGARGATFIPQVKRPKHSCGPFWVQENRWIVIRIRWMKSRLPFANPVKREDLIGRIDDIPGCIITAKVHEGFPRFELKRLSEDRAQLNKFDETLDWILTEIRSVDS